MSCVVLRSPGGDEPWGTPCSFTLRFGCSSLSPRRSWRRVQTSSNPLRRLGLIPQHPPESAGETRLDCEPGDSRYGSAPAEPPQKHRHPPLCCCADLCPRQSFSPGCRNFSSFLPSEGVARGRRGRPAPGGGGGVSLGAIPWGVRSWGAPRERGGSGAWREPARQSRVLISHRSHATTFCSGCCPTFQSHTSASDFNGLHHSPKLYLTKRRGEMAGGCQKSEQSGPRGLPGHSRILRIAPGSREQQTGFPGVFLGGPSPTGGVLRVSEIAPGSPAALPPRGLSPAHPSVPAQLHLPNKGLQLLPEGQN